MLTIRRIESSFAVILGSRRFVRRVKGVLLTATDNLGLREATGLLSRPAGRIVLAFEIAHRESFSTISWKSRLRGALGQPVGVPFTKAPRGEKRVTSTRVSSAQSRGMTKSLLPSLRVPPHRRFAITPQHRDRSKIVRSQTVSLF